MSGRDKLDHLLDKRLLDRRGCPLASKGSKGVPRAEREQQILDVAAGEFARRGFAALSVADVARAAGISKPLIYGYFGSKEGLYVACATRAGEAITGNIASVVEQPEWHPLEVGAQVLGAVFSALEQRPTDWLLLHDRSLPPGSAAEQTALHYLGMLAGQASEGIASTYPSSVLPDPLDQAALTQVWMNIVSALVEWWLAHPDQTAQQMIDRSQRLMAAIQA